MTRTHSIMLFSAMTLFISGCLPEGSSSDSSEPSSENMQTPAAGESAPEANAPSGAVDNRGGDVAATGEPADAPGSNAAANCEFDEAKQGKRESGDECEEETEKRVFDGQIDIKQ